MDCNQDALGLIRNLLLNGTPEDLLDSLESIPLWSMAPQETSLLANVEYPLRERLLEKAASLLSSYMYRTRAVKVLAHTGLLRFLHCYGPELDITCKMPEPITTALACFEVLLMDKRMMSTHCPITQAEVTAEYTASQWKFYVSGKLIATKQMPVKGFTVAKKDFTVPVYVLPRVNVRMKRKFDPYLVVCYDVFFSTLRFVDRPVEIIFSLAMFRHVGDGYDMVRVYKPKSKMVLHGYKDCMEVFGQKFYADLEEKCLRSVSPAARFRWTRICDTRSDICPT